MKVSRRVRRGLLLILGMLAVPPALYLAFTFAFLELGLGQKLLNRPQGRVQLDWQGGYSWRPGVVHVRGFSLVGRSPRGTWRVDLDRAELRHGILPLLGKTFLASSIQATGASGGWTTFEQPIELPPPSQGSPGWKLLFPDIEITGFRDLELDETRIDAGASPGQAKLALEAQVRGPFAAPRLQLTLENGTLRQDGEALGSLEVLSISGRLEPFRAREHRGTAWLRFAHVDLELRTDGWDLRSASYFFRGAPVEVDGRGRLDADLTLEAGVLQPSSQLIVSDGEIDLIYADSMATGRGGLRLEAHPVAHSKSARLELVLDDFALGRVGQAPHMRGHGLRLVGRGPVLDLVNPTPEVVAELQVDEARVPDFAALDAALPAGSPLRLVGGAGTLGLQLAFASKTGHMSGRVELVGEDVEATYQDQRLIGDLRLGADLDQGELASRRFQLSNVRLDLDQVATDGLDDWWARIELPSGEVVLTQPFDLNAQVSAVLRDALPLVHLLRSGDRPKRWLQRLLEEKRVQATAQLELDDEAMWVEDFVLRGGRRLTSRGQVKVAGKTTEGLVLVEFGPLAMAAEFLPDGERDYQWAGSRRWFEGRLAAIEASPP